MHTGHIEVANESHLQAIYFPIKPVCHYMSKATREHLMENINRESAQEKVSGLMQAVPDLIEEMQHNEQLSRKTIKITPRTKEVVFTISCIVSMAINLLILCFWDRGFPDVKEIIIPEWADDAVYYLGYVQMGLSSLVLLFYLISQSALMVHFKWREHVTQVRHKLKRPDIEERIKRKKPYEMSINQTLYVLHTKGPNSVEFYEGDEHSFGNVYTWFDYAVTSVNFMLQDNTLKYYIVYAALSFLGHFFLRFFYAMQILVYAVRIPTLNNVIKSVTLNKTQLLLTGMLILIVLYIYAVIGFFFLPDMFYDMLVNKWDDDVPGEDMCQDMVQCFLTVLNFVIPIISKFPF